MEPLDLPNSDDIEEPIRLMSDTQIQQAQLEHKRSYHRKYYHEHKTTTPCPHCGKDYSSASSLRRHQGRSSKCKVQKLVKEVDELKSKLAGGILV